MLLLLGSLLSSLHQVGKSAFISSLIGRPALAVYNPLAARDASPSTTPHPQSVNLSHKKRTFKLIDTPGLSFIPPSEPTATDDSEIRIAKDILMRNRGNISKIKDPLPAALYILSRAIMEDLIMLYNLPAVQAGDYDGFLTSLARKEGAVQRKVCMFILC
jgi:nuclear GTP-binding protein